ncbi:MAG: hypothetical protein GY719_26085 [bacterium]|nr:hypothetical protein [bacterium]
MSDEIEALRREALRARDALRVAQARLYTAIVEADAGLYSSDLELPIAGTYRRGCYCDEPECECSTRPRTEGEDGG